ncbi:MAG: hypothetical protein U0167_02870 [bacterium]
MRTLWRGLFLTLAVLLPMQPARAQVVIIAHPGVGVTKMDADVVRRVYLGQQVRLGDVVLVPAVLSKPPMNEEFTRQFLQRTASQFTSYWRSQVFSGKGLPPKAFDSESRLLDFVRTTPGALAFVDSSATCRGVRVIEIER